jgi:hypothetical protein
VLLGPGIASAQQSPAEKSADRPHMTSSGPSMAVPNANANPGVVDPTTQGNNDAANDRSNPTRTVASEYQEKGQDKMKSKKHRARSPTESKQR